MREDVQPPAPVQAAPAEPQEKAGFLVHGVREELPVFIPPQHTPPDTHWREAVRLRTVREEVHAAEQSEGPPAHAQRGAALQLLAVRENLHPDASSEATQNHPHVQLRGRCVTGCCSGEKTQMRHKTNQKASERQLPQLGFVTLWRCSQTLYINAYFTMQNPSSFNTFASFLNTFSYNY